MADSDSAAAVVVKEKPRGIVLPKTFIALRHRNYRLYFAGQLISLTGMWMANTAQPWLVYQMTGSPLYLGIVSFSSSIPALTLSLWAGVIVDRVPKRRLLLLTQMAAMLNAFALAVDIFSGWAQPWHIVIFAVIQGVINAFDAPARQAFVFEMVGREDLTNAVALNSAAFQIGRIFGPTLAGILLALVGPAWCFLLNGFSFLALIFGLNRMEVRDQPGESKRAPALKQLREGLSYIWRDQTLRTLFGMVAVANIFAFGYSALLPAFARDVLDAGPAGLGFMGAAVGAGALIGALIVARYGGSGRTGAILTLGNILMPLMVIAFALSRSYSLSLIILFFAGMSFMLQNTATNTLIQMTAPDALRGRIASVQALIFFGLFPLGALMAGFIAEHWGIPAGAGFGGSMALIFGMIWLWRAPFVRKLS